MRHYPLARFIICAAVLQCVAAVTTAGDDRPPMTWPAPIKPGDTLMFVAPAGPAEKDQVLLAKKRFEDRGYKVKYRDDMLSAEGYLAGSDQRRADELMQAFLDPEVKGVMVTRGGYGVMRILDRLDYDQIHLHPKVVVGYSDITALHAALNRASHLVTFHGPGPASGLGREKGPTDFTAKYMWRAIEASAESAPAGGYEIDVPESVAKVVALGKGKARGRLVGGNLSMVSALEGTPYSVDCADAILLIEDVSEAPYRIDRMLQQLKLAGKLGQIRGAVLGQFTKADEREKVDTEDPRYTIDGVLRHYFADAGIPVLMNFPVGHADQNCTLPLGGQVEIDADKGVLRILGNRP